MLPSTPDAARIGVAVIDFVARVLTDIDAYEAEKAKAVAAAEEQGFRIIDGGFRIVDDGLHIIDDCWEIRDWRTDEVIASGTDEVSYGEETARLDPDDKWWHIDVIEADIDYRPGTIPPAHPLPPSMAEVLVEWVESNEDDARALVTGRAPAESVSSPS